MLRRKFIFVNNFTLSYYLEKLRKLKKLLLTYTHVKFNAVRLQIPECVKRLETILADNPLCLSTMHPLTVDLIICLSCEVLMAHLTDVGSGCRYV